MPRKTGNPMIVKSFRLLTEEEDALIKFTMHTRFDSVSDAIRHHMRSAMAEAGFWPPKQKEQNTNEA